MLLAPLTYKPKSPPRRSRQEPAPAPELRSPTKEARPAAATQSQRKVPADLGTDLGALAPLTYKPEPVARRSAREPDATPAARPPTKETEKAPTPEPQPRVTADVGILSPLTYKPAPTGRSLKQEPVTALKTRSVRSETSTRSATETEPKRPETRPRAEARSARPETRTSTEPQPKQPETRPATEAKPKRQEAEPELYSLAPLTYKAEASARPTRKEPATAPEARPPQKESRAASETGTQRKEAEPELYSLAPLTYQPQAPVRPSRKEPAAAPEARPPHKGSRATAETSTRRKEVDADIQPLAPLTYQPDARSLQKESKAAAETRTQQKEANADIQPLAPLTYQPPTLSPVTYKPPSPPRRLRKEQRTIPESRPPRPEVKAETETRPRPLFTRSATESQSPRKQSAVAAEPPSPRRQPWSAIEPRFPRQHIATPTDARFPRQHIATPTDGYFPRQHIATPIESRFSRREISTAAAAQSHRQDARTSAFPAPPRQDVRISALPAPPRQDGSSAPETRKRNASLLRLDIPRGPLPVSRFSPTTRSASPSTACSSAATTPMSALPPSRYNDALSKTSRRQASPDSAISLGSAAGRTEPPQHQYYERSPMLKSASCHTLRGNFKDLERGRTWGMGDSPMEMGQPAIHVTDTAPRTASSYGHDRTGTADYAPEGRRVVSGDAKVVRPPSWFPALKKAVSMEGPRLCIDGRFMQCDIIEEGGGHKDTDGHSVRATRSSNNLGQAARTASHGPRTSDGRPAVVVAAERKDDSIDRVAARARGSGGGGEPRRSHSPASRGIDYSARHPRRVDPEQRDERGMSWLDL
ncbi:hypothetical protein RB597_009938 [Gaeumannomyces tritici]